MTDVPESTVMPVRGTPPVKVAVQWLGFLRFRDLRRPPTPSAAPAPASVRVDSNVSVDPEGDGLHRVVLTLGIRVTFQGSPLYEVDIAYGGLFRVDGATGDDLVGVLTTACPALLFPSVRQAVAEVSAGAGFPPLILAQPAFPGERQLVHPPPGGPGNRESAGAILH